MFFSPAAFFSLYFFTHAAKLFPAIPLDTLPAGLSGPILTHPSIVPSLIPLTPLPLTPIEGAPIEGVRRLLMK